MNTAKSITTLVKAVLFIVLVVALIGYLLNKSSEQEKPKGPAAINPILQQLQLDAPAGPRKEGVAVAVLVDTSGSMADKVAGAGGQPTPKIDIARRCLVNLMSQAQTFTQQHKDKTLLVGVYEFSSRDTRDSCRIVLPLGKPDAAAASATVKRMHPDGSTPIGDAIIRAQKDLAASGMSRTHIMVITDGENNRGYAVEDVVNATSRLEADARPALYFFAFDVSESVFAPLRASGAMVLPAADETQLRSTLDYVLTGKILAEEPAKPGK